MELGKVYSIITRRQLNEQDYAKNDKEASEGIYIGCLPKNKTVIIRNFQNKILCEQRQIDLLQEELQNDLNNYHLDVIDILKFFRIKTDSIKFNVGADKLMIGEDGHTWLVLADMGCEK